MRQYLAEQPLAKHQIREGIWKKESEITIVDALVKLANVHEIITASLHVSSVSHLEIFNRQMLCLAGEQRFLV